MEFSLVLGNNSNEVVPVLKYHKMRAWRSGDKAPHNHKVISKCR
jgi:hypothetical protein